MIIAISVAAIILLPVLALIVQGQREHAKAAVAINAIVSKSVEAARIEAIAAIQSGAFSAVPASGDLTIADIPSDIRDFFGRYEEISKHEFWVGQSALSQNGRIPGYIKIGGDSEFEEILVKPSDERVFLSYPEDNLGENPETLPSIWHKILLVALEEAEQLGARRVA